jgi:hypothetical protein
VTTSGMRRESRWGSVISETGWPSSAATPPTASVLQRDGRPLDVEPPLRRTTGGKKAGRDEEDHCSRIRPRVAWQQKSRTLSKRGESMESHPSVVSLLGSRVLPRPERQYSGICSERQLRFECPDHEPAKAVVGSR